MSNVEEKRTACRAIGHAIGHADAPRARDCLVGHFQRTTQADLHTRAWGESSQEKIDPNPNIKPYAPVFRAFPPLDQTRPIGGGLVPAASAPRGALQMYRQPDYGYAQPSGGPSSSAQPCVCIDVPPDANPHLDRRRRSG